MSIAKDIELLSAIRYCKSGTKRSTIMYVYASSLVTIALLLPRQ